jgi:N utilization substance protein B
MVSRRRSRERALQVLFNWDARGGDAWRAVDDFYGTLHSEEDDPARLERDHFMEELVKGTAGKVAEIDRMIAAHSANWRIERMPAVDRTVIRIAIFEMLDRKLPAAVIIDEAIEIIRRFSGDESSSFVNGVLDSVNQALRREASLPDAKSSENPV